MCFGYACVQFGVCTVFVHVCVHVCRCFSVFVYHLSLPMTRFCTVTSALCEACTAHLACSCGLLAYLILVILHGLLFKVIL